jgi:hypothetical protein
MVSSYKTRYNRLIIMASAMQNTIRRKKLGKIVVPALICQGGQKGTCELSWCHISPLRHRFVWHQDNSHVPFCPARQITANFASPRESAKLSKPINSRITILLSFT